MNGIKLVASLLLVCILNSCLLEVKDVSKAWGNSKIDPALVGTWAVLDLVGKPNGDELLFRMNDLGFLETVSSGGRLDGAARTLEAGGDKYLIITSLDDAKAGVDKDINKSMAAMIARYTVDDEKLNLLCLPMEVAKAGIEEGEIKGVIRVTGLDKDGKEIEQVTLDVLDDATIKWLIEASAETDYNLAYQRVSPPVKNLAETKKLELPDQSAQLQDIVDTAVSTGSFKTLAAALDAAGLVDPLKGNGPFTVFAPTDAAFAKLPKGTVENLLKPENKSKLQAILKFHVVSGNIALSDALAAKTAKTLQGEPVNIQFNNGKVMVNDASLITADIKTSNGVIHVIDSVMLPPATKNDIASVAKKAGQFNTLLAAVDAAGLSSALSGENSLTVFAPTDAAFKALPKGTVESLLKPENRDQLKAILSLHIVSGKVSAGSALNAKSAKALSGGKLKFGIEQGVFKVNGATIVTTDIQCDNGVIHVIDRVILPSAK